MFSKFFIERPRFAAVVSLLLVITGILTMFKLPVAEYPEISPPQIRVSATYSGASADMRAVGNDPLTLGQPGI